MITIYNKGTKIEISPTDNIKLKIQDEFGISPECVVLKQLNESEIEVYEVLNAGGSECHGDYGGLACCFYGDLAQWMPGCAISCCCGICGQIPALKCGFLKWPLSNHCGCSCCHLCACYIGQRPSEELSQEKQHKKFEK